VGGDKKSVEKLFAYNKQRSMGFVQSTLW